MGLDLISDHGRLPQPDQRPGAGARAAAHAAPAADAAAFWRGRRPRAGRVHGGRAPAAAAADQRRTQALVAVVGLARSARCWPAAVGGGDSSGGGGGGGGAAAAAAAARRRFRRQRAGGSSGGRRRRRRRRGCLGGGRRGGGGGSSSGGRWRRRRRADAAAVQLDARRAHRHRRVWPRVHGPQQRDGRDHRRQAGVRLGVCVCCNGGGSLYFRCF